MNDPETMEYNAGYDMELKGYERQSGTISKTDEEMLEWYDKWINKEPDRFFAYIYDFNFGEPVGEVYIIQMEKFIVWVFWLVINIEEKDIVILHY